MDDKEIIALYHQRDPQAILESDQKYGGLCRSIARNILTLPEDAEECVNDTWHAAWNRMPPDKPHSLGAFLGRIVRNISISRYRKNHAAKRYDGMEVMLSELEECVPAPGGVEQALERAELGRVISVWLDGLEPGERHLFIRRYWYGEAVKALAQSRREDPNSTAQRLWRLRRSLKAFLEAEGVSL